MLGLGAGSAYAEFHNFFILFLLPTQKTARMKRGCLVGYLSCWLNLPRIRAKRKGAQIKLYVNLVMARILHIFYVINTAGLLGLYFW